MDAEVSPMINLKHAPAIMAIVREGSITAASKKL